jgi:hypothetical protein
VHRKWKCACPEGCDARECLLRRSPELRRNDDECGSLSEQFMDERCECTCHDEERELYPEPWEVRP